jgi:hypothetical protein
MLNQSLRIRFSDSDSAPPVFQVLVFYPSWQLDPDTVGPFQFWWSNLRTILFVVLVIAGLIGMLGWLRPTTGKMGVFVATVGVTALSATIAGLASAVIVTTLLDPLFLPTVNGRTDEFLLSQLSTSAEFGVLFGSILGAAVIAQLQGLRNAARRTQVVKRSASAPKSFW